MLKNVADWERLASIGLGAALVTTAVARRRALGPAILTGAALVYRGASGSCPVYRAAGLSSRETGRPAFAQDQQHRRVTASVTINRPAAEVFAFWRELENLSAIFKGVDHVERIDDRYTRWSWRGPGGMRFEWMAETTEAPPHRLSWRSLPGADLDTSGTVRFTDLTRGGCEVTVTMDYDQPGGPAATAALWVMGRTPEGELREDLRRLKHVLETGELPIGGDPSGRRTARSRAIQTVAS
jgi:uncharacterized membrane protein